MCRYASVAHKGPQRRPNIYMKVRAQECVFLLLLIKAGRTVEAHCSAGVCLFSQLHLLSARACVCVCVWESERDSLNFVVWSNLM